MKPVVAIVGRPNVGKSTLFNRIIGQRVSIVEDTPGVTRDRIYGDAEWNGAKFTLIDTGGIDPDGKSDILVQIRGQAELAIDLADVIILVTDAKIGLTSVDSEVAGLVRRSKKPIVVVCNKSDTPGAAPLSAYEFYNFGIADVFSISSVHGIGVGDMLDKVVSFFPAENALENPENLINVAVIGRPNVGKSSLINRILGENRLIVSDVAGTTRDAIDSKIEFGGQTYNFIDTAGMRKRKKVNENVEKYSVIRALSSIDRSDVCLCMIDMTEGVSDQDTKIFGYAYEQGKACVILVNKWDLNEKNSGLRDQFLYEIGIKLKFMKSVSVLFVSAKTGSNLAKIFSAINSAYVAFTRRATTGQLNSVLGDLVLRKQPPSDKGRRLKIYYITQVSIGPPTFVLFINDKKLAHFSYVRYIENQIRENFDFCGTPVRLLLREKGENPNI